MPYNLTTYDGTSLVTIADGTVDNQETTSLFFIGKNVTGYGLDQNNNFLYLLENFAGSNAPLNPQVGQLWFDKTSSVLRPKVYNGGTWRTLAVLEVSTGTSDSAVIGDLWFDTDNKQLWAKSADSEFTLVGPQMVKGFAQTGPISRAAKDNGTGTHAVVDISVNGVTVGVFANETFTLDGNDADYLQGFTTITKGLTLNPDATLAGLDVPNRATAEEINSQWNFTEGVAFGASSLTSDSSDNLILSAGSNVIVDAGAILPNDPTVVIGGVTTPFAAVYANALGAGSALTQVALGGNIQLTTNSKIAPALDNNNTLGTVTSKWKNIYTHSLTSGAPTNPGSLEGDWVMTSGSSLSSDRISTQYLTANTTSTSGVVEGQWTLTKNSTFQATELIDANGNEVKMSITATSLTIVERGVTSEINASQFNGNVLGTSFTATSKISAPTFNGTTLTLTGSIAANTITVTVVTASNITATVGIKGNLTGNVTGDVTGNVTGNVAGTLISASDHFTGNITGNVTGNVVGSVQGNVYSSDGTLMVEALTKQIGYNGANLRGNLTGNSAGTHTGPVTGNLTGNSAGTHTGPVVGNVTGNVTGHLYGTADNATAWAGANKFVSSASPDPNSGVNGDFWFQYEA